MLLRVLGSFQAEDRGGEPLDLGGPRQRAVLAMLFAAGGQTVSAERLVDGLWHGRAPARAVASLQAYVSNLRRVLEPERPRRGPARLLVTAGPGYALRLPADTVDAGRFEAAHAEARRLAADDPVRARQVLTAALALWRGAALGEFAGEPWARAEAARLAEKRLAAREFLLDLMLRTGDAADVVPEAELLTGQAPRREEGWRLLALALWRAGRQADALAALRRARAYLAEEHGLDPGPALVELESAILSQDAIRLDGIRPDASAGLFVGRDAEGAALRAAAGAAEAGRRQIVLLTGEAGAGKTTMLDRLRRDLTVRGWQVVLGRIADSIRRLRPDDHSALAHHYARAGSAATASRAVTHAIRAAELAESRYAYDAAVDLLSTAAERAGPAATRIDLLGRLLRAQARAGATAAARRTRSRAIDLAAATGRDDLMIAALTAWRVPSPWSIRRYGEVDQQVVDVLTRLLRRTDLSAADRCRLLEALVSELEGEPDPRAEPAGREALALARAADDPELRALGLAARLMTLRYDREAPVRRALARELGELATELNSATYGWFAEQVRGHAAAVLNEPATVRDSVTRQETMARRYQLSEALAINLGSQGALAHVAGDFAAARLHYAGSVELMRRQGSLHADAFEFFTAATLLISQDRLGEHVEASRIARKTLGPLADDLLALALIADGRPGEARAVPWGSCACRPDYFQSGLLTFRAMVVVAFGRSDLAVPLIEALLPVRDQLAGFSTTAIVTRPVALTLGELFRLRGDETAAAEHFALAASVARRWEAPHWQAEVRSKSSPSAA